ncbi:tyrosine-type recombinase/integrase [Nonomuraea jabiensis]|uniref:Integrase n=1 Tax=Nonomuraea jabiensis TaxID=882448 RepID=A0A7W9LCF0_9ACTN|nr:site-specific integrase [Nonomuraea jabiensis]MBB5778649.1 integrase [Nonomuraea jabiensis]
MSTEDLDFSIYFDASKNAWIAAVSLGFDGAGRRVRRKASVVLPRKWQDRPVGEQREQAIKLLTPKVKKLREEAEKGIKTKANYRVSDAVEDFLTHGLKGRSLGTITHARSMAENQIKPKIGNYRLKDLRAEHVDLWLDELAETLATKTIIQIHNLLTRAIRMAEKRELVGRNVSALCETPHGQEGRPSRSLTLDQAVAVLKACEGEKFGAYVITSLLTGIRPEEARKLLWEAVDLRGKPPSISVLRADRVGGDTKTKKSRRALALPALVVDELKRHRAGQTAQKLLAGEAWQEHDLVFARDDGTPLDPMRVLRGLRVITKKAGIGNRWKVRELRHSFVSILSDGDVSVERIADLVGHSTPTTTQTVYRHQIRPVIVHGAETMDAVFGKDDQTG